MDHQDAIEEPIAGLSKGEISEATAAWIEHERHIPIDVAVKAGVVTLRGWPAFQYRDHTGFLRYHKVRVIDRETGEKSFRRDRSGVETCLYGEDQIALRPELLSPLIWVEGEIDRLSLLAAECPNVISVPDGAQHDKIGEGAIDPSDDRSFGWLWHEDKLKRHIDQFSRHILAVDNDRKGRVLREELAVRLGRTRCWYVEWPEGSKDANDVLRNLGAQALAEVIANAKPLVPDRLVPITEIVDPSSGEVFASGIRFLDEGLHLNFMPPELVVITGQPGSGKSEFAGIIGCNLANFGGIKGAILQFEDRATRVRDTVVRYALANVPGVNLRSEAHDWARKWIMSIEPEQDIDAPPRNLAWLTETLREARQRHDCRWAVLDPWNELEHLWDKGQTEASYINDALRFIKRLSRALNMLIMIVAHPTKEGGRQKDITEMSLYDMAGGASWYNKADHGFIIHRPDQAQPELYCRLAKVKDHQHMGRPGIVQLRYEPSKSNYIGVRMGV
jgi:twinkle protein